MSISKAERLFDLVIALLNSRSYRAATWIRERVAGYQDATSDEAFSRMFERDKQELRDMGIPIETDVVGDGYRIRPGEFALDPLTFTPAESAALAVASRLWETTVLGRAQASAIRKMRDAGASIDPGASSLVHARLRTSEPAFAPVFAALRARRAVRFDYRGASDVSPRTRHIEPWGLVSYLGAWYVVGHDRDRGARRTFRLSRISGDVVAVGSKGAVTIPTEVDLKDAVARDADEQSAASALLRIRRGTAAGLRRQGTLLEGRTGTADRWPDEKRDERDGGFDADGYDDFRVPMSSLTDTARRIAQHGPDVLVTDPPELREAVRHLLAGAVS